MSSESSARYELQPLQGAGPIRFGMARDVLLEELDAEPAPRDEELPPTLVPDHFHDGALRVHYSGDRERVVYVEFEPTALEPDAAPSVILCGKDVFRTPAVELLAHLDERSPYDRDDPELGVSYAFLDWELTLWRPVDPDAPLEAEDEDPTEGEDPAVDDDPDGDEEDDLPADAGRYFARVGLGVRGYVSGERD